MYCAAFCNLSADESIPTMILSLVFLSNISETYSGFGELDTSGKD